MRQIIFDDSSLLLPLFLQLVGLLIVVCIDPYFSRTQRMVMLLFILLTASLVAQNYAEHLLVNRTPSLPFIRRIIAIYGYSVRPAILVLFLYIIKPSRKIQLCWILVGINMLVYLTALFDKVAFWISSTNHYVSGPLWFVCLLVSIILIALLLYYTIREFHSAGLRRMLIPMIVVLAIIGAAVVDNVIVKDEDQTVSFLTIVIVSSSLLYYIWLHLEFVYKHEKDLKAQQRIKIMISQIQPHFLYNTLSTIQVMCKTEPELAAETICKFSIYLRQNLESLEQPDLIPFEKELEHTKVYSDIEEIRFENIRVEYDISDTGFRVPALSVQPLVENAIRHGVRIRKDGLVTVTSRRDGLFHEIIIQDNGKGFDPEKQETADTSHIGLKNVRERLKQMCDADMTVESRLGEGTRITIRIPEHN